MSDVDYDEIMAQRYDHAAEMIAEHEAAMRQAIDALAAEGLPIASHATHVDVSSSGYTNGVVHAIDVDGVRRWAQRLGSIVEVGASIDDFGVVHLNPRTRVETPAGTLIVIGAGTHVKTGITGASLVIV